MINSTTEHQQTT